MVATSNYLGRWRLAFVLAAALVVALIVHRIALAQLRSIERHYVDGRRVTACATARLEPFAAGDRPLSELDSEVEALIADALDGARAVRSSLGSTDAWLPFPPLSSAERSVQRAIDEQVSLYEQLTQPGAPGDDTQLRRLGSANGAAEDSLDAARGWLLVDEPPDWGRRFTCEETTAADGP